MPCFKTLPPRREISLAAYRGSSAPASQLLVLRHPKHTRRLWDVRYTAIHSWVGTIGILVEKGWNGGWSDGRRNGGMSPLIGR